MRIGWLIGVTFLGCGQGRGQDAAGARNASPSDESDATGGEPGDPPGTGGATSVADPALPGPWVIGVMTVEMHDPSRGRDLPVELWYPVDPAAPDGRSNTYKLTSLFGTLWEVDTPARRDATPAAVSAPLLLFSHGYGGIRFQSYFLSEHLASHGYVVAAPDHPGNTLSDAYLLGDSDAAAQSAVDRPLDILFVTDTLLAQGGAHGLNIDPLRIGASGHSFGGWTALEVARRDQRFAAVLPMAPGFKEGATPDFVAELRRPLAIFGGSLDQTTPFESDQRLPYDLAQPPKHLLKVIGAGHLDFSNLCEVPLAAAMVDDGCDPDQIDPAVVHARVRTVAAAFAGRVFMDPDHGAYLDTAYVEGLGDVEYWRAE